MKRQSVQHLDSAPQVWPRTRVNGVIHERWRPESTSWQMACGFAAPNVDVCPDNEPVTCVWCLAHRLPWLRWTEETLRDG